MGFFSKVGGAAAGLTGLGIAGYGAYKVGKDNPGQAISTGQVTKEFYDSTDSYSKAAGAGLMEAYFQNSEFNENFGRNLGISGLGLGLLGVAATEFADLNQYLNGAADAEE